VGFWLAFQFHGRSSCGDLFGRVIGQLREHVGEPSLRIDAVHLGGLCRPSNYAERVRYGASL
jgi:hypothetical protein